MPRFIPTPVTTPPYRCEKTSDRHFLVGQVARQALTSLALAFSVFLFPSLAYADTGVAGQVQVVVGTARLIDSAGKEFAIARGTELKQGDRIVTDEGALVQVRLSDGSFISVRTNTDMTFKEYRFDTEGKQEPSLVMNLVKGALRSITGLIGKRTPNAYRVTTPTATVGIRGTDHEPVFIPEPSPGEIPMGIPGTYDKVNSGATFIQAKSGIVDVGQGQVGFVPITPGVVPKILPVAPEFFRKLDPKGDSVSKSLRQGTDSKLPVRQLSTTLTGSSIKAGAISSGTLSPATTSISTTTTLISPTTTLSTTTLSPATATLISPTTSTLSTTTLSPTTSTLISPTLSTTSTLISPTLSTTTLSTSTISPTLSTTTISPMLSTTTISPTLSPTISPTLSTTTISPTLSPTISPTTTFSTTILK